MNRTVMGFLSRLLTFALILGISFALAGCMPQTEQAVPPVEQEKQEVVTPDKEEAQAVIAPILQSPVIDGNYVTFNYINPDIPQDTKVFLRGNMPGVGWDEGLELTRDPNTAVWSLTLENLPQGAYEYKFFSSATDWIADPLNPIIVGTFGNSSFAIGEIADVFIISVAGNFQQAHAESLGEVSGNWMPGSDLTKLTETEPGSGIYSGTFRLPAGKWGYKITIAEVKDGVAQSIWIPEGLGNERILELQQERDVTFTFNYSFFLENPDSEPYVDSINYKLLAVEVFNEKGELLGFMHDNDFDSIYRLSLGTLDPGKYVYQIKVDGIRIRQDLEIVLEEPFDLELIYFSGDKTFTTNFAATLDNNIFVDNIYHNSHVLDFRNPFGAVRQGAPIRISLRTAENDASSVTLMLGGTPHEMKKQPFEDHDLWYTDIEIDEIGIHHYYFIIKDGTAKAYYTNNEGFGGTGRAVLKTPGADVGYPLVVYYRNFDTPDWMKNSITYQIFPERFHDGDPANNRAKTLGRGDIPLIFPEWSNFRGFEDTRTQFMYPEKIGRLLADGKFHEIDLNNWGLPEYKGDRHWHNDFYGGDLQGIIDKLDYLQSLGVRALYLNPVFEATSVHKYDASDKSMIDRMFGDNEIFRTLTSEAQKRGMHVIMDGIFNHIGDDSKYFDRYGKFPDTIGAYEAWVYKEMQKNNKAAIDWYNKWYKDKVEADKMTWGPESPFDSWFEIRSDGTYHGWWGHDSLPEMGPGGHNETSIPSFMDYMVRGENSIATKWIKKYGSSGWRLDVSPQVETAFWREFRLRIHEISHPNGQPIMIAENWGDATLDFLGDTFDSTMNYIFRSSVASFIADETLHSKFRNDGRDPEEIFNPIDAHELNRRLMNLYERYPREAFYTLMNLLGSHDSPRILKVFGSIEKDRLLYPGQRNEIARRLGVDPAQFNNVFTIPDIWRQNIAGRREVLELVNSQNELAQRRLLAAYILQMGYPGSPTIYYGDELGMTGQHDPDNRRQMRWDLANENNNLLSAIRRITQIRNQHQVLKTGGLVTLLAEKGGNVYAFGRYIIGNKDALGNTHYTINYHTGEHLTVAEHNGKAVIAVNKSRDEVTVTIDVSEFAPDGTILFDNLNDNKEYTVQNGQIKLILSGLHGAMLVDKPLEP